MLRWLLAAGMGWVLAFASPAARAAESPSAVEGPEAADPDTGDSEETAGAKDETAEEVGATPTAGIETLMVVGGVGGESWRDVPTSTVGFDAQELQQERIQNIADVARFTPNLEIKTSFAAVNPVIVIRGIGLDDFNANATGAVAVYQDGIYMNSPAGQLFGFFDLESVDVRRGPQAGGYRNASAGAILIQSRRPARELGGHTIFTYGNYNLFEGEAAVNLPIGEHLATRVSGKVTKRDGYTLNRCFGQKLRLPGQRPLDACEDILFPAEAHEGHPPTVPLDNGFAQLGDPHAIHKWVNDADNWAARAQLLFDVPLRGSSMEWLLNVHGGQNLGQATQFQHRGFRRRPGGQAVGKVYGPDLENYLDRDGGRTRGDQPGDPWAGDYNSGGDELLDLAGASLSGRWAISDTHELVSLSGFEWHDRDTLENSDGNSKNLLTSQYRDEAWQVSQDLRLESYWTDRLNTFVGAYFIREDLEAHNLFDSRTVVLSQDYEQLTRSFAAFGGLSWDFLSWSLGPRAQGLTLAGDVRYVSEYKKLSNFSSAGNATVGPTGIGFNEGVGDNTWTDVSGSVSLIYRISEEISAYAKYTRGWKPGHLNGGALFSEQLVEPVLPESVDAFEVGARTSWFDGRLSVDSALFYYEFSDMQIFQLKQDGAIGVPLSQLINAQGATMWGTELQLYARPVPGLDIRYNLGFLNSEYSEFVNRLFSRDFAPPGTAGSPAVTERIVYTGNEMVSAPRWSISGSVQYELPLRFSERDLGFATPRFSFSWKDDHFFDPAEGGGTRDDLPEGTIGQPAYWLLNASLAWRSPDHWPVPLEMSGWVRNILEEKYRVSSFDATQGLGFVLDVYGAPRTYGLTLTARF